jgi:hypothetical protein
MSRENAATAPGTLPGMPTGTPGMPGEKTGPLEIYEIGKGARKVYAVV